MKMEENEVDTRLKEQKTVFILRWKITYKQHYDYAECLLSTEIDLFFLLRKLLNNQILVCLTPITLWGFSQSTYQVNYVKSN